MKEKEYLRKRKIKMNGRDLVRQLDRRVCKLRLGGGIGRLLV